MNDFNREHDSMYIQNLRKKTMQSEKMYLQMFVQIYKGLLNVGSLDDFGMLKVFFSLENCTEVLSITFQNGNKESDNMVECEKIVRKSPFNIRT